MTCKTVKEKESLTGATVPMGGQAAAYLWAARRLRTYGRPGGCHR